MVFFLQFPYNSNNRYNDQRPGEPCQNGSKTLSSSLFSVAKMPNIEVPFFFLFSAYQCFPFCYKRCSWFYSHCRNFLELESSMKAACLWGADFESPLIFCHSVDVAGIFVFNKMLSKSDCLPLWRRIRQYIKREFAFACLLNRFYSSSFSVWNGQAHLQGLRGWSERVCVPVWQQICQQEHLHFCQ